MSDLAPSNDDPTRARLIAAAAEVFAEKGYDRAGVQEIARRAGFTTGAIYGRFTGKAELLLAAIGDRSSDELEQLFAEHRFSGKGAIEGVPKGSVTDILTTVGSHLVAEATGSDDALLLEAFVAARRDPEVATLLSGLLEERAAKLAELIGAAKATGAVDDDLDTESIVRFCHAVGFGFLMFRAVDLPLPAPQPWEALITRLVDALEAPLASPKEDTP
jgi:AcrR family transcriptional regulator